jgi:hypothetical protein
MPWAIYDDLSGVAEVDDMGIHATEEKAIEALILHLESNKTSIVDKIAKAKRRRRALKRRNQ